MLSDRASLSSLVAFMVLMCVKLAVLICFGLECHSHVILKGKRKGLESLRKGYCYNLTKCPTILDFYLSVLSCLFRHGCHNS